VTSPLRGVDPRAGRWCLVFPAGSDAEPQPFRTIPTRNPTERPNGNDICTHAANQADQGEWLQTRPGERCLIRVAAAETNGAYSVVEGIADPGDSTPVHVHQNEDEHFLVLEGTARILRGDETFDAPVGTTVALPRNIPHAWGNATNSTLRMIVACWPGGVEAILPLIARGGDIDVKALGAKFGVRVVGPPLLEE
jgi:mannose-6-phosphate isomerase-like protein (cupin superfamily)